MPLIFPASPDPGDVYTDSNSVVWQFNGVVWNVITGSTKKLFNGVKAKFSTGYALTSTLSAVSFDLTEFDTNSYFNIATPSRLTIQQTGYYQLNLVAFTGATGAGFDIVIKKNGSTTISSVTINANQSTAYNEVLQLNANDYIELYANDNDASGELTTSTYFEIVQYGQGVGVGISSSSAFSGVRTILTSGFSTTATPTAIAWDATDFDTNANSLAVNYWNALTPSRITIAVNGYYQIDSIITVSSVGDYTVTLKKNGTTTLAQGTLGPNGRANIDQVYELLANDYIELVVSDTTSSGTIISSTYLEVIRMGV